MKEEQFNKLPKWAQEEFRKSEEVRRLALALRWPIGEKPKPFTYAEINSQLAGKHYSEVVQGWFPHQYNGNFRVELGCSTGTFHSRSNPKKTDSQNGGVMYRTRLDALLVCRHEATLEAAKFLAKIDAEIEKETLCPL